MDQEKLKNAGQLGVAMVADMVPGQAGGSFISTVRFATLLRERGHHVIIIAAKDSKQEPVREYKGIPIYQYFSLPTPGSHRYYFQSFPRKSELHKVFQEEKIDVVHIMFPSYSCFRAKQVARELGLPLVAHIHTQPENIYIFLPSFLKTKLSYDLISRYLTWFVRGAQKIICPSELGKQIYHSYDPSLPISVISNGVNLPDFHTVDVTSFMQKYALSAKEKQLLFIGRLADDKDPMTLIRALPDILKGIPAHLNVIGTGPLMEELRSLAKTLRVSEHVTFLGKVSDEDRLAAYNVCDLFVLPSKVELEGMVVLEAMACGKPILIANAETSASRYFVQENGLLFKPEDPRDLAAQALRILGDTDFAKTLGKKSLSNAQEYDIHRSVEKLEALYYSIV